MSQESIYLQDIIFSLYAGNDVYRIAVTDFEDVALHEASNNAGLRKNSRRLFGLRPP